MDGGRLPRYYLGGLLAAMALGQALSWDAFTDAILDYGTPASGVLAIIIFGGEVGASAGILTDRGRWRRPAAWIGLAVASVWTILAVQAFARGLAIDNCGCFGAYLSQSLRWWILIEDAAFVALAVLHLRNVIRTSEDRSLPSLLR